MSQIIGSEQVVSPYYPPRGMGADSVELLQKEGQVFRGFYAGSMVIQNYAPLAGKFYIDRAANVTTNNGLLSKTLDEIRSLTSWDVGPYDSPVPDYSEITRAESWIRSLFSEVGFANWLNPNVTVGPEGEIVFEWWHGAKKLTVYISRYGAEYVKVWGIDIHTDMVDGDAEPIEARKEIWTWLRS